MAQSSDTFDIVVLGAGYGGMSCITRISRLFRGDDNIRIHLVDRHTYHLLETRLHERAVREEEITIPIAQFLQKRPNVAFHLGEVTRIDLDGKYVELDYGESLDSEDGGKRLGYDRLVIALGSKTNFYQIPGLQEHAYQLKELSDSEQIREHTERMFALAASESNPLKRKEYLRFVIGGGGLTGVELATEMVERFERLCDEYHISRKEPEMILVELAERILPSLPEKQVQKAIDRMLEMGVILRTGTKVMGMETMKGSMVVKLQPGDPLPTRTVVWTGGIRISDLVAKSGAETGSQGRVVVDEYLQLVRYPGVFAIGDNALAMNPDTGEAVPTAAQFALQQGYLTADNLRRNIKERPLKPYKPKVLGEVISLGKHLAVGYAALPFGSTFRFIGFLGSLIKRAITEKHLFLLWKERQNWTGHW